MIIIIKIELHDFRDIQILRETKFISSTNCRVVLCKLNKSMNLNFGETFRPKVVQAKLIVQWFREKATFKSL